MKFRLAVLPLLGMCLAAAQPADRVISMNVRDADVLDVIRLLAAQSGINIITDGPVKPERITMYLHRVPFDRALRAVLQTQHLEAHAEDNILIIRTKIPLNKAYGSTSSARVVSRALVVRKLDSPSTRAISLHFLRPSDALERLQRVFPDPSYVADDETSTLSVTGNAQVQNRVKGLLAALDVGERQVAFDVQIVSIAQEGNGKIAGAQTSPVYVVVRNSSDIEVWLKGLVQRGLAHILGRPQLSTLDNRQAEMVIRQTYPEVFPDPRIGEQVAFVRFGVTLQMRPSTNADGSVRTQLHVKYSAVAGFSESYPLFGDRSIASTLRVGSGQTIVFGGVLSDIDNGILTKVPTLLEDPVFGKVFRQRSRTRGKDAIVFLITPRNTGSRPPISKVQPRVPVSHRR